MGFDEPRLSPWEEEGRRQAETLDHCHFVVVIGDDPGAAAELALGIARVHAQHRRAAVADAVGELPSIEDLAPMDAPHGIVDICLHGVSLAQVAHRVIGAGLLDVLPSGPTPFDRFAVLSSPRWERLATEFRDAGALLLLVVPAGDASVDALLSLIDGIVLVGRAQPIPGARVLLYVRIPGSGNYRALLGTPTPASAARTVTPPQRAAPAARLTTSRPALPDAPGHWPLWITAATAVVIAGFLLWRFVAAGLAHAPVAAVPPAAPAPAAPADSDSAALTAVASVRFDSGTSPVAPPPPPPDLATLAAAALAARADSDRRAAAYAVEVAVLPSATAANARLDDNAIRVLPALTYSPITDSSGDRTWRVYAGAYRERIAADSLLLRLRADAVIAPAAGRVVRLPIALVVQSGITRDEASFFSTGLRAKGLPVYPLVQEDGLVRLYAGAFERAADAALLLATLRANGETPSVTYRIGRLP